MSETCREGTKNLHCPHIDQPLRAKSDDLVLMLSVSNGLHMEPRRCLSMAYDRRTDQGQVYREEREGVD